MSLIRRIFKGRSHSGGKDSPMGDQNTATPPADQGGNIDYQKLAAAISTAVVGGLSAQLKPLVEHQKIIADTLAAQAKPEAATGASTTATGGILEQVAKLLDEKLNAQQQSAQLKARREAYQAEKLKDLPPLYRNQLGDDPEKWAMEEQKIRTQFQADLRAAGVKIPDVMGTPTQAADSKLPDQVDLSKLSPLDKIARGISQAAAPETKPEPKAGS